LVSFKSHFGVWVNKFKSFHFSDLKLFIVAVGVGLTAGLLSLGFRECTALIQWIFYRFLDDTQWQLFGDLPWYWVLLAPTIGGLFVGLYAKWTLPNGRPVGIAQVMESSALDGGRMSLKTGFHGAIVNAASIGAGASAGREGPVVHLGATVGAWVAKTLGLPRGSSRILLGAGVSAAVAAAFNAPLAGVFFALEVVIGHYAVRALAPIVAASVVATTFTRYVYGPYPAFQLAPYELGSHWEYPAFALLGIVSAFSAIAFMRSVPIVSRVHNRFHIPQCLRPMLGGIVIGVIALSFPQVLGVGYGATTSALDMEFGFLLLVGLIFAKTAATAITLGSGFGGGVFSPSLFLGAAIGGAFGIVAGQIAPGVMGDEAHIFAGERAYALVGMGAYAAAILGAPISTILMIFEITTDYALTTAVMIAVVASVATTSALHGPSFFRGQFNDRGIDLEKNRLEADLLRDIKVEGVVSSNFARIYPDVPLSDVRMQLQTAAFGELFVVDKDDKLIGTITLAELAPEAFDRELDALIIARDITRLQPPMLEVSSSLQDALRIMENRAEAHIPIVDNHENRKILGVIHERDIMLAYNEALVKVHRDESAAF
jgi:CIC family chloride channel protein